MAETINIKKRDIWTAIWHSSNLNGGQKLTTLLRSLIPSPPRVSTTGSRKIAFVVGHNSKRSGAYAYPPLEVSEYEWNSEVGKDMVRLANADPSVEVAVFYRKPIKPYSAEIDDCYRRVNKWNPDIVIEGHFNWLNGAGRIEMISYPNSPNGKKLSEILLRNVGDLFIGFKRKHLARRKSDRGGRSLWAANAPAVMTEPFDCSNEKHREIVDRLGTETFARIYINSAKEALAP